MFEIRCPFCKGKMVECDESMQEFYFIRCRKCYSEAIFKKGNIPCSFAPITDR